VHQENCYNEYAQYELTIREAVKKYNNYLDNQDDPSIADAYLFSFMDECSNSKCSDATAALAASLTGNSGLFACDMLKILYYGDVESGNY